MCLVVLFTKHLRYMHTRKCIVWKAVFSSVSPLLATSLQVLLFLLCLGSALERQRSDFVTGALSRTLLDNHMLALRRPFSRILVLCMNHQGQTSEPPATNKTKWMEHSASITWPLSFTWTVNTQESVNPYLSPSNSQPPTRQFHWNHAAFFLQHYFYWFKEWFSNLLHIRTLWRTL